MPGVHIESGNVVLQKDAPVTIEVGPFRVRFSQEDPVAMPGIDFAIQAPFDIGVGEISTTNAGLETQDRGNAQLLVVFTSGGAHGEFVAASYSLYQS